MLIFFSRSGLIGLHGPYLSIMSPVLLQFLLISTMCWPLSSFLLSMFLIIVLLFLRRLNSRETQTIPLSWFLIRKPAVRMKQSTGSCRLFSRLFYRGETTQARSPGGDPVYLQDLTQMRGDSAATAVLGTTPNVCLSNTACGLHCRREELWTLLDTEWTGCSKCKGWKLYSGFTLNWHRVQHFRSVSSNMDAPCGQWGRHIQYFTECFLISAWYDAKDWMLPFSSNQ